MIQKKRCFEAFNDTMYYYTLYLLTMFGGKRILFHQICIFLLSSNFQNTSGALWRLLVYTSLPLSAHQACAYCKSGNRILQYIFFKIAKTKCSLLQTTIIKKTPNNQTPSQINNGTNPAPAGIARLSCNGKWGSVLKFQRNL